MAGNFPKTRTPAKDEQPEEGQFYARHDKNEGTLHYNGTLAEPADAVFLKLFADDKLVKTETAKPGADKAFAFAVKLKPGLAKLGLPAPSTSRTLKALTPSPPRAVLTTETST